ncbi:MAG: sugar transferase, partial [Hyphomicrobiaceae bacterium]
MVDKKLILINTYHEKLKRALYYSCSGRSMMSNRAKEALASRLPTQSNEELGAQLKDALHRGARGGTDPRTIVPATDEENGHRTDGPVGGRVKRATDIILSLAALVGLAPVFLMIGLLIRVPMGGPVLYFHERVGYGGKRFRCYKFRSMVNNSDEVLARHLESDADARQDWAECQKMRNDPRVSALGRFLRASSLDELPQIFNILKGEMSCVGPRPVTVPELKRYG